MLIDTIDRLFYFSYRKCLEEEEARAVNGEGLLGPPPLPPTPFFDGDTTCLDD